MVGEKTGGRRGGNGKKRQQGTGNKQGTNLKNETNGEKGERNMGWGENKPTEMAGRKKGLVQMGEEKAGGVNKDKCTEQCLTVCGSLFTPICICSRMTKNKKKSGGYGKILL